MNKQYWSLAFLILAAAGLLFSLGSGKLPQLADASVSQSENQIIKEGVSIAMSVDVLAGGETAAGALVEDRPARLQFNIRQAQNRQPVKGLHPAVWLEREHAQENSLSCKDRIASYLQSQMAFKPEISLNAYFVLTMNNTAGISVIDPINGFGGSKLIARVRLHSPGADWALSKDQQKLYVITPATRELAVIDTQTWQAEQFLTLDATPARLVLQQDGKYLWVALADDSESSATGVSVIDSEKLAVVKTLNTGKGRHEFAFSDDGRTALVSNSADRSVTVVDIEALSVRQTVSTPGSPVATAFSALSQSGYAATDSGKVLVIHGTGLSEIDTGAALKTLRISGDGRWIFALSQAAGKVFVIDASLNRLAHTIDAGDAPDQIAFTDQFAYVRSTASEIVRMIQLDALGQDGVVPVTTFPGGQSAPGASEALPADAITPTPERSAVVVANPADKTVYYYMEGMAAPMGNFENQGLKPMAVLIVNRSIQETAPGVYTGSTQLPPAGRYSVAILLDKPTVYHCFSAEIEADPELAAQSGQPVKVEYLMDRDEVPVGSQVPIDIKLTHAGRKSVDDTDAVLQVMLSRIPGQWQQRMLAQALGDGMYRINVTPPETGIYQLFVQSDTLHFSYREQPALNFRVVAAAGQ